MTDQQEFVTRARDWAMQRGTVENFPATARAHILGLADLLLSKLRAPVADERAAFEAAWRELNAPWPMNSRMHDDGRYATPDIEREWRLWQARAALASAPVVPQACPTDVCQAAKADGVLCANDECDRANGVRPASAPVADERAAFEAIVKRLGGDCTWRPGYGYVSSMTRLYQNFWRQIHAEQGNRNDE